MIDDIINFLLTGINYCFDVFSRFITGGLLDIFISVFTIVVVGRFLLMPLMAGRLPSLGSDTSKTNNKNNTKSSSKKNNKGN